MAISNVLRGVGASAVRGKSLNLNRGATSARAGGYSNLGTGGSLKSRAMQTGAWMRGNLANSLRDDNVSLLRAAGGHAARGGVFGGLAGGISSSAQGGSFWDGAKEGAFNGAVGWTGYRMGMRATAATSRNPFSQQGPVRSAVNMFNATSQNPNISRPAQKLLQHRQMEGLSRAVTKSQGKGIY